MILVAGSANLDFVVRAHHIPAPGETVLGQEFKTFPGGKGANQAVACAKAGGASTHMLLAVGSDAYAEPLLASLKNANVQIHQIDCADQPTGCAFICVADNAENAITVAPGANLCLQTSHLPDLSGFTHLLMQLEIPIDTVTAYAQAAKARGIKVVLNAAPAQPLPRSLLNALDLLIVNEGELSALVEQPAGIASNLQQIAVPGVVVTLGHRGCIARLGNDYFLQPAFDIDALDTTGAGDTFCGALVAALSHGLAPQEALRQASAAAALACTRHGAQSSVPSSDEVDTFLRSHAESALSQRQALSDYCGLAC